MPFAPEDLGLWVAAGRRFSGVAPDGQGVRRALVAEGRSAALKSAPVASWGQESVFLSVHVV